MDSSYRIKAIPDRYGVRIMVYEHDRAEPVASKWVSQQGAMRLAAQILKAASE